MNAERNFKPLVPRTTLLLAGLAAVLFARQTLMRTNPSAPHPNLLLITVDTLRSDELGAYGSPFFVTPALDRLSRRGSVYEVTVAPSPWTLPSIASIMTGLEPKAHGAILFRRPLPERVPTLAERLKGMGYHTSAAVTHFILGPEYGFDRGFDRFERKLIPADDARAHLSTTSEELSSLGIELLQSTEEPFFVWLHYFDPHFHYLEHPPVTSASAPGPGGRDLYRGEIQFTDRALGALLSAAEALPNPPAIIFTADHGEQFFEHGAWQHTTAIYQEVVRVPLLIANPQQPRGQLIRGLRRLVEVNGLILEMAGATPAEEQYDAPVLLHSEQAADLRGIVAGRYKLVSDLRKQKLELFDLYADAAERTNLAAELPDLVRQLCASLDGHFAELTVQGERLRGNEEIKVSEERSEQLESLGYTQAPVAPVDPVVAKQAMCPPLP